MNAVSILVKMVASVMTFTLASDASVPQVLWVTHVIKVGAICLPTGRYKRNNISNGFLKHASNCM